MRAISSSGELKREGEGGIAQDVAEKDVLTCRDVSDREDARSVTHGPYPRVLDAKENGRERSAIAPVSNDPHSFHDNLADFRNRNVAGQPLPTESDLGGSPLGEEESPAHET